MWPFEQKNQQMYQQYANAWDQGTYGQSSLNRKYSSTTNTSCRMLPHRWWSRCTSSTTNK